MARADNELVGRLVGTGALALGRLAPRGNRVTATRGAAFTTTVRVVDRVHGDTANRRTAASQRERPALPSWCSCDPGSTPHRRWPGNRMPPCGCSPDFKAQQRHGAVTANELCIGTGGACNLATLARLHLHVVDDRADRHGRQRHAVARLHVNAGRTGHHGVAFVEALRSQNVGQIAVSYLIRAMNAVRFGSYSRRSTVPTRPRLRERLKSTMR
jgi:hypothetical protein